MSTSPTGNRFPSQAQDKVKEGRGQALGLLLTSIHPTVWKNLRPFYLEIQEPLSLRPNLPDNTVAACMTGLRAGP